MTPDVSENDARCSRIRSKRSHSEQPLALVRWTAGLGAVTAEALACREDISLTAARARLRRAVAGGLLCASKPLHERPALYTATRAGMRAAGCDLEGCRVGPSSARHLISCAAIAAGLERCYPEHSVQGERELRRREREHHRRLASVLLPPGRAGGALTHCPDLVLWPRKSLASSLPLAVEVELTVKSPRRLQAICRAWARCDLVAGVLYLAAAEVELPLRRAIQRAQASSRVLVLPLQSVPGPRANAIPCGA